MFPAMKVIVRLVWWAAILFPGCIEALERRFSPSQNSRPIHGLRQAERKECDLRGRRLA
jgi:hypothetical protein